MNGDPVNTILLLGGSGFLGSNIGQALMDAGYRIFVVDHVPPRWDQERYQCLGVFVPSTHDAIDTVSDLLARERIGVVIHLASNLLPGSSLEELCSELSENLVQGIRLVELLQSYGIQRFVFLSSGGTIYGRGHQLHSESDPPQPLNYYGWMKQSFEEFLHFKARVSPLQYLILRPSNPYGRYQNLRGRQGLVSVVFGRILDQLPLEVWGDGSVLRDYIHIDDFCQASLALINQPRWNTTFNIGSGQGASVIEVIELSRAITGMPLQVEFRPPRTVDTPVTVLDISRMQKHFHSPMLSLRTGMERYWAEIQKNGGR